MESTSKANALPSLSELNAIWDIPEVHDNMQEIVKTAKDKSLSFQNYSSYFNYCVFGIVLTNNKRQSVIFSLSLSDWKYRETRDDGSSHLTFSKHKIAVGGVSHLFLTNILEEIIEVNGNNFRPLVVKNLNRSFFCKLEWLKTDKGVWTDQSFSVSM